MTRNLVRLALSLFVVASPLLAEEINQKPDWSDVNAIFADHCIMCHAKQGAGLGLRLDSYGAVIAGSTKGPVLLSGDAERSELIRRLRGQSKPRMPFLSYPLREDQIDLIARWINAGLPVNSSDTDASQ